jgi:hypothetical protein
MDGLGSKMTGTHSKPTRYDLESSVGHKTKHAAAEFRFYAEKVGQPPRLQQRFYDWDAGTHWWQDVPTVIAETAST